MAMTVNWLKRAWDFATRWRYVWLIALLVAFSAVAYRLERIGLTTFSARIHTKSIAFDLADWADSAGIFNSDLARVDVTLPAPSRITAEDGEPAPSSPTPEGFMLQNVKLASLDLSGTPRVSIDVEGGVLHFTFKRSTVRPSRLATVIVDANSTFSGASQGLLSRLKDKAVIWIISADRASNLMELGVGLRSVPVPEVEEQIPLKEGGTVSFRRNGGPRIVLDSDNVVEVRKPNRRFQVREDIALGKLHDAKIRVLGLHLDEPTKDKAVSGGPQIRWLDVTISGQSRNILLISDGNEREIAATALEQLWPANLSTRAQAVGSVLAAFGAIGYLIKEFVLPRLRKRRSPPTGFE